LKLWGGRFTAKADPKAEGFTSSISFDRRLYRQDIAGSIAHARMLAKQGIIGDDEGQQLADGLQIIAREIEAGQFPFRQEHEDIHMNIEARLVELIGPVAGKLHTARSRNDQVALDMHMFMREEIAEIQGLLLELMEVILARAEEHRETVFPGYTHLQRAQPVLFSHHLMAYFFMFRRDYRRFEDCARRADVMPLGAAALAGTPHPIDRQFVADQLGFSQIYENSMDAVSDRDYLLEFLAAASITMMHLSRMAEELILWSSQEFNLIEMDDAFSTGSSIMPQKKNPDVAEILRGKIGRVYGSLMGLLTVMKGLPLAYHSDMQEDKEGTFDAIDTLKACLTVTAGMLGSLKVKEEEIRRSFRSDFSVATDVADYLVSKGVPFRQAHEAVGKLVLHCVQEAKGLADLTTAEFQSVNSAFADDVHQILTPEASVGARKTPGGTAPAAVAEQIAQGREFLGEIRESPGGTG